MQCFIDFYIVGLDNISYAGWNEDVATVHAAT